MLLRGDDCIMYDCAGVVVQAGKVVVDCSVVVFVDVVCVVTVTGSAVDVVVSGVNVVGERVSGVHGGVVVVVVIIPIGGCSIVVASSDKAGGLAVVVVAAWQDVEVSGVGSPLLVKCPDIIADRCWLVFRQSLTLVLLMLLIPPGACGKHDIAYLRIPVNLSDMKNDC